MNAQKNLRNLLDACVKRCKVADQFRAGVYEVAKVGVTNPEEQRRALIAICQMCDPKYVATVDTNRAGVVTDALGKLSNNHGPGSPAQRSDQPEGEARDGSGAQPGSTVRQV